MRNLARLYRDSIHGDIELDPFCVRLLDAPELQRLGRIQQLGFADLVFRGATHTRLSHMIGTYAMTKDLFKIIEENHVRQGQDHPGEYLNNIWGGSDARVKWQNCSYVVAWAALLHDLTHIPFGHTLEDEFWGLYINHDSLLSPRHLFLWGRLDYKNISGIYKAFQESQEYLPKSFPEELRDPDKLHQLVHLIALYREGETREGEEVTFEEEINGAITAINQTKGLAKLLDDLSNNSHMSIKNSQKRFLEDLKKQYTILSSQGFYQPFMTELIANTICADLLDYLERDAVYTGLALKYDKRLLKSFTIQHELPKQRKGPLRLALKILDTKGVKRIDMVSDVLNLMKMRHDLALKVYYHKTKAAASAMLVKALQLLGDERPADLPQNSEKSILNYRIGGDGLLAWMWQQAKKKEAKQDAEEREKGKQARGLIEDIWNRKIYKTLMLVPFDEGWDEFDSDGSIIRRLRENAGSISQKIAEAKEVQSPRHYILLYVPALKDKAKEVDTRALWVEEGRLVKLGKHPALSRDIEVLNDSYKRLWKLLLLIHPSIEEDRIKYSTIADELVGQLNQYGVPSNFMGGEQE